MATIHPAVLDFFSLAILVTAVKEAEAPLSSAGWWSRVCSRVPDVLRACQCLSAPHLPRCLSLCSAAADTDVSLLRALHLLPKKTDFDVMGEEDETRAFPALPNSIHHNLSLNDCLIWTLDPESADMWGADASDAFPSHITGETKPCISAVSCVPDPELTLQVQIVVFSRGAVREAGHQQHQHLPILFFHCPRLFLFSHHIATYRHIGS
ncbi:hypothetical protein XELAEV_18037807mg [Xenopus laevis]|uniref:Uncharacterized protein n=1 Tax=Xenopus laevis TaxID=8355 RepID=A0A974CCY8_XENLA|nr:hypothetical protein XELAEV_18037807mg [Xenopus laevis]